MQLSKNLSLLEMTNSQTAKRLGISNQPTEAHLASMKVLAENIFQPIRKHFTKPFQMTIDFNDDYTNMTVTVSQNGKSQVIYDALSGKGSDNSDVDMASLKASMEVGWWITPSYWEGYSPKGPSKLPWFVGDCYSDQLCKNNDNAWVISNVKVTAEEEI